MIPPKHCMRKVCIFCVQKRWLSRGARVVADLTSTEATSKEERGQWAGDWRAYELGHESLGAVQLFQELVEAEVQGPKAAPSNAKDLSCRAVHPPGTSSGRQREAGAPPGCTRTWWVQLNAPVVQAFIEARGESLRGFMAAADGPVVRVEARHVHWAVAGLGEDAEEQGSQRVILLLSTFPRDFLRPEQEEAVIRVAQIAVFGQSGRDSDFWHRSCRSG